MNQYPFPDLIWDKILFYLRTSALLNQSQHRCVMTQLKTKLDDQLEINLGLGRPHISCGDLYLNFRRLDHPQRYFAKPPFNNCGDDLHHHFAGYVWDNCGDKTIVGIGSSRIYNSNDQYKPNLPLLPDRYFYSDPKLNPRFCFG